MSPARFVTKATAAVVAVGGGRGVLVHTSTPEVPVVLTAAHCLPHLPPAHPASYTYERTYRDLLGPLGGPADITAECVFVDPIADLAVLASPDGQAIPDEAEAFDAFVAARSALTVEAMTHRGRAWVLTLEGRWEACRVDVGRRGRTLTLVGAHTRNGMSGSPILDAYGRVVGVVSVGAETGGVEEHENHGQPAIVSNVPPWLLSELWPVTGLDVVLAEQDRAWERYLRRGRPRSRRGTPRQRARMPQERRSAGPRPPR